MAAGKLVVLMIVGGLAGAVFAGMTAAPFQSFRAHESVPAPTVPNEQSYRPATPPEDRFWLDQGVTAPDRPAWPFGARTGSDAAQPDTDYAPYAYGESGDGGYDSALPYDSYAMPPEPPGGPPDQDDAAADAAEHAARAAQDVMAAERGG